MSVFYFFILLNLCKLILPNQSLHYLCLLLLFVSPITIMDAWRQTLLFNSIMAYRPFILISEFFEFIDLFLFKHMDPDK